MSRIVSRTEIPCPLDKKEPLARRRRAMVTVAAALIGAALSAPLGAFDAAADAAGDAARTAQENHACAVVLALNPSEAPYHDCVASIDRYLPPEDPPPQAFAGPRSGTETYQKANTACADIGLDRNSSAFGQCVADLDARLSDQGQIYR